MSLGEIAFNESCERWSGRTVLDADRALLEQVNKDCSLFVPERALPCGNAVYRSGSGRGRSVLAGGSRCARGRSLWMLIVWAA
ncbi:hypothetical protein [Rhodococcus pyridinivorans]|uniref:hypothetical protein n=1 Tax=Rhodococcus pyridinivorans TaxID=103816 RepID=UPI0026595C76|nr:hypothetical protein [Rhodococcus pyridinivorans]